MGLTLDSGFPLQPLVSYKISMLVIWLTLRGSQFSLVIISERPSLQPSSQEQILRPSEVPAPAFNVIRPLSVLSSLVSFYIFDSMVLKRLFILSPRMTIAFAHGTFNITNTPSSSSLHWSFGFTLWRNWFLVRMKWSNTRTTFTWMKIWLPPKLLRFCFLGSKKDWPFGTYAGVSTWPIFTL